MNTVAEHHVRGKYFVQPTLFSTRALRPEMASTFGKRSTQKMLVVDPVES